MTTESAVIRQTCAICGESMLFAGDVQGYVEGEYFKVYRCESCETSCAVPTVVDEALYEVIYSNADALPGYWRYAGYASQVLLERDPLEYLAGQEDMYWAVRDFLVTHMGGRQRASLKILEIGSGLGYLTYAVRKAGFDITGLELSALAVARSRERYGDLFSCGAVEEFAIGRGAEYDIVILTEVIEHVVDPVSLLNAAMRVLRPNGKLLITTPSRSYYLGKRVWGSDCPPVHLWWFSERSMEAFASRLGATVNLLSFRGYNFNHPLNPLLRVFGQSAPTASVLDRNKVPRTYRGRDGPIRGKTPVPIPWTLRRLCIAGLNLLMNPKGRRMTIAAVFSRGS